MDFQTSHSECKEIIKRHIKPIKKALENIQTRVAISGISQYFSGLFEIFLLVGVVATKLSFMITPNYLICSILHSIRYVISNSRICFPFVTCHGSIWNQEKMLKYSNTQMALICSKSRTENPETGVTYDQSESKYNGTRSLLAFPFLTLKIQEFLEYS